MIGPVVTPVGAPKLRAASGLRLGGLVWLFMGSPPWFKVQEIRVWKRCSRCMRARNHAMRDEADPRSSPSAGMTRIRFDGFGLATISALASTPRNGTESRREARRVQMQRAQMR